MPLFKETNKYVNILPRNSDTLLSVGENGKEIFYIKNTGETPFGSPEGTTFTSLVDTPKNICDNVNCVLGSVGDRIDFITDTKFNNLNIEDKLQVKHIKVDGVMSVKGTVNCNTTITTKQIIVDDIVKTNHIHAKDCKIDVVECDLLNVKKSNINDLLGNVIECKNIKANLIQIASDTIGSIGDPVMISKAETRYFDMLFNQLDVYFTFPFNNPRVEFTVKTECLLQEKMLDCIVNTVYGDDEILLNGKMINVIGPDEFKVVLILSNHSGSAVMKLRLSII